MTLREATRMTPEQIAHAREKDGMVAMLDQILDFLEGLGAAPRTFVTPETEGTLMIVAGLLRQDILTAAGERVR
jgi:hypothetical protein